MRRKIDVLEIRIGLTCDTTKSLMATLVLLSFGHRYGVPGCAMKFDVRGLPNPSRRERSVTGLSLLRSYGREPVVSTLCESLSSQIHAAVSRAIADGSKDADINTTSARETKSCSTCFKDEAALAAELAPRAKSPPELIVAIGCFEGKHRSVVVVEQIAKILQPPLGVLGCKIRVLHRDLNTKVEKKKDTKQRSAATRAKYTTANLQDS